MSIRRIAYILPKYWLFSRGPGGAVTHACGVASGLVVNGIDVTVVAGPGAASEMDEAVRVSEVEGTGQTFAWERRVVERTRRLCTEVDGVIVRYSVSNAWRFSRLMQDLREEEIVTSFEVNSLLYHQESTAPYWIRKLWVPVERWLIDVVDVVYVVSEVLKNDLSSLISGDVAVIPNGGPPPWDPPIAEMASRDECVRFCYLGKLKADYEYGAMIEAFTEVGRQVNGPVELHFYGDGPRYKEMRRLVMKMPGVFCHGRYDLGRLQNEGEFNKQTVLTLPYIGTDTGAVGSPTKLYEYMAMGGAIVAANVGDVGSRLQDGKTALLYERGSVESLTGAMLRLARDKDLRLRLGKEVQGQYAKTGTWPKRMAGLLGALNVNCAGRET